jgi:hypothetical protein
MKPGIDIEEMLEEANFGDEEEVEDDDEEDD